MTVYWVEQREADLPGDDGWLAPAELVRRNSFRFPKRRTDWQLGRWTAKRAVAAVLRAPPALAAIEIRPDSSGAPAAFLGGAPADCTISISHRSGIAACAVAPSGVALGCDLELVEPRSDAFVADYFTGEEQAQIERAGANRYLLATLIWSAKESALKALHTGLRRDTRSVKVNPGSCVAPLDGAWHALETRLEDGGMFRGWWQISGCLVRTMAANPGAEAPHQLPTASIRPS